MFVNNFIYFYIGVCLLLIIFEVLWGQYIKLYNVRFKKKKINYKKQILAFARGTEKDIEVIRLTKELKNINNLMAFQSAYEEISKRRDCKNYIYKILSAFIYLNIYYSQKKSNMEKAYFAYVISKDLDIENVENINVLLETLYEFLNNDYISCRVNAMNAICVIGKVDNVKRGIKIISDTKKNFNSILLANCLKSFRGDKQVLAQELFEDFETYEENVQIAMMMYLSEYSFVPDEKIIEKLDSNIISVNVKCEILRYFQVNLSEEIKLYLLKRLNENNMKANDFNIKAIGTLGYYTDDEVFEFLNRLRSSEDEMILETAYRSIDKIKKNKIEVQV